MPTVPKLPGLLGIALMAAGCQSSYSRPNPAIGTPNPASVYCVKSGGKLEMLQDTHGEYGMCTLPSGERIEEWTLFRREHAVPVKS